MDCSKFVQTTDNHEKKIQDRCQDQLNIHNNKNKVIYLLNFELYTFNEYSN